VEGDAGRDESCRIAQYIVEMILRQGSCIRGKKRGGKKVRR